MKKYNVNIYGDSILKGVVLNSESHKYYFLKNTVEYITSKLPLNIINKSKFGCTVTKGFSQLKKDLTKKIDCDVVVLEYGGNDCDFDWQYVSENPNKDFLPHTPIEEFKQTYLNMIAELKKHSITPILTSIPPINAEKYINWICRNGLSKSNIISWLGDVQKIYRFQELYSNTIEKIAHSTGCILVDIRKAFLENHNFEDLICEDGIHPSELGQHLIRDTFYNFAAQMTQA